MITEEQMRILFAKANPIPDEASVELDDAAVATYLATLEHRSSEMTQLKERAARNTGAHGQRWIPAVAATTAVVLAIGAAVLLANRDTEVVAAGVGVAQDWAVAVSSGETDLSSYVTDEATIGPFDAPLDEEVATFWAKLDTDLTLTECTQVQRVVTCDYRLTNAIREVQARPELGTMTFLIEGSEIAEIAQSPDPEASQWLDAGDPVIHYMEWLNTEYPGWELELDWLGEPYVLPSGFGPMFHDDPVQNSRYAEVLLRHLGEYEEFLATSGGISG